MKCLKGSSCSHNGRQGPQKWRNSFIIECRAAAKLCLCVNFLGIRHMLCAVFIAMLFPCLFCSGSSVRITQSRALDIFGEMEKKINDGKGYPRIKEELLSEKGFFYVLTSKGQLLMHPNSVFIGRDFSDVKSVQNILSRDRGNETVEEGGVSRRIIYAQLRDGNYLCLSIDSNDYEDGIGGNTESVPKK